ncbi:MULTISPECIES: hypothetical protein [Brevibacillus]|uniref:hypothetical protein n=1 Tax=Brevibacillus TaxID=55080 RepID=UPI0036251D1D
MSRFTKGVNPETGEIGLLVPIGEGHKIISPEQTEGYKLTLRRKGGRGHAFTFTDMERLPQVIALLDTKESGYLLYLQCFVGYDNTLVVGAKNTPMDKRMIREVSHIGETTFRELYRKLIDYGILIELENGMYAINELYHFRGKTRNLKVIKSFTSKIKALYEHSSVVDLGFIYRLLPYVHYDKNVICTNPLEMDAKKLVPLSQTEITEITGIDESTVRRKLGRLFFDGMYVFAQVRKGREVHYKLNPFLFYRKDGSPDAFLKVDFLIKGRVKYRAFSEGGISPPSLTPPRDSAFSPPELLLYLNIVSCND